MNLLQIKNKHNKDLRTMFSDLSDYCDTNPNINSDDFITSLWDVKHYDKTSMIKWEILKKKYKSQLGIELPNLQEWPKIRRYFELQLITKISQ